MPLTSLFATCLLLLATWVGIVPAAYADTAKGQHADIIQLLHNAKPQEALAQLEWRIAAEPRNVQLRFLRGVAQSDAGQQSEAIQSFIALIEQYPELPEPYNNVAVLYAAQNQLEKARAALETAVRIHPGYATAHENLGDIYARLAAQSWARAEQLEPAAAHSTTPKLQLMRTLFQPSIH